MEAAPINILFAHSAESQEDLVVPVSANGQKYVCHRVVDESDPCIVRDQNCHSPGVALTIAATPFCQNANGQIQTTAAGSGQTVIMTGCNSKMVNQIDAKRLIQVVGSSGIQQGAKRVAVSSQRSVPGAVSLSSQKLVPASVPGAFSAQRSVSDAVTVSAQKLVPASVPGAVSAQRSVPGAVSLSSQKLVPASVPGAVSAQRSVSDAVTVSAQGSVPGAVTVSAQGSVPGAVTAQGSVPGAVTVSAHGSVPGVDEGHTRRILSQKLTAHSVASQSLDRTSVRPQIEIELRPRSAAPRTGHTFVPVTAASISSGSAVRYGATNPITIVTSPIEGSKVYVDASASSLPQPQESSAPVTRSINPKSKNLSSAVSVSETAILKSCSPVTSSFVPTDKVVEPSLSEHTSAEQVVASALSKRLSESPVSISISSTQVELGSAVSSVEAVAGSAVSLTSTKPAPQSSTVQIPTSVLAKSQKPQEIEIAPLPKSQEPKISQPASEVRVTSEGKVTEGGKTYNKYNICQRPVKCTMNFVADLQIDCCQ